jgi:hypothetical protein
VAEREANTVIELREDLDLDAGIEAETGEKIVETGINLMNPWVLMKSMIHFRLLS